MRFAIGALALAFASAPALAEDCPAERAVYTMHSDDDGDFRAQFIPAQHMATVVSDLYLKLTTTQRSYWFGFSSSNGYGGITALPVSDPYDASAREEGPRSLLKEPETPEDEAVETELLSRLRFIVLDENLQEAPGFPSSGDAAPPYVMMPDVGLALWYGISALTEDEAAERDSMPRGVFRLTECLKEVPAKAWP